MGSQVGDLGRRISERRQELGLSVEELAHRTGMDPVYANGLEMSSSPQISRVTLWKLASALNTTIDLLTGAGTQAPPGRANPAPSSVLVSLDAESCRELIRPGGVGRVVFTQSRGPVALPVNFRVLDDNVIFRTSPLPELTSTLSTESVSFEVDHIDEALTEGWSVLISGHGHIVEETSELKRTRTTGVAPWAGGEREIYVCIVPRQVTGRRIRAH